ncbi:MAG: leucyl aminopeptidase family protein [Alphaproteobacteria bacterium]
MTSQPRSQPQSKHISLFNPYLTRKRKTTLEIHCVTKNTCKEALAKLDKNLKSMAKEQGFEGKSGQILIIRSEQGIAISILAGTNENPTYEDGAKIHDAIKSAFSKDTLDKTGFTFSEDNTITQDALERLCIGWGWAAYEFTPYKNDKQEENKKSPALILPKSINKKRVQTCVESVALIRDLVNTPANDMGPDELEETVKFLCKTHDINTLKIIKDKSLLSKNFPMIYDVGKGSARRPRLLDFTWGKAKDPRLTLVGKGVCFDTGGLDIKPSQFMLTMKKDMGGAAHVLALAHMIISLKLPVRLRVLVPTVENSISGECYRPGDILQSRKGSTVEVGNTDAEGRLILADSLTYACEEEPDLLIDFATLTGAARVALGHDLPALFATSEETALNLQQTSSKPETDDPLWNMPLWEPYKKELKSPIADISSTGGKAGAITAALFLNHFIELEEKKTPEWIHLDIFAWEATGKSGKPKGGADTGMRAVYNYLENRYKKAG